MEQKTVQYKRTLRGSVGAGVGALFNGNGRRYFILEHKDASKYYKAGDSQKIIIDQIELGRDKNCQVRFDDETFPTVSRRHAAIIKDGDKWKLVQLSQTNSTFLNNRPITTEWYLENGDEIQLSVGGPRLGFIVPQGKQSLVSSIKMTERLELFRKQALRPYKTAIACLALLLVLSIGGLGGWNYYLQTKLKKQGEELVEQTKKAKGNKVVMDSLNNELVAANKKIGDISINLARIKNKYGGGGGYRPIINPKPNPNADLNKCMQEVYYVKAIPCINGKPLEKLGWSGTGFLLNNGYFVTAQHMVHIDEVGTKKDEEGNVVIDNESVLTQLNALYYASMLTIKMVCVSSKDDFVIEYSYQNNPFVCGKSKVYSDSYKDEEGRSWNLFVHEYESGDWAYAKVNKSGGLAYNGNLSTKLPVNTQLHILGFPSKQGVKANGSISPIYSQAVTSRTGLEDDGTIKTSNDNTDHGNSGGPVLVNNSGKFVVVGILSGANFGSDASHRKGRVIPIGAAFK